MAAVAVQSKGGLLLLLLLALMACIARGQQEQQQGQGQGRRPFSRRQAMTGQGSDSSSSGADAAKAAVEEDDLEALKKDFTKPTERAGYLLNLTKNGVEPLEILSSAMNSRGWKAILQHAEIQHRIMEENPLLEAFDGFKELKAGGRRLSEAESTAHFQRGMAALMEFAKASLQKNKNPAAAAQTIAKMATSGDPAVKDLFKRAQAGEHAAVEALQDVFAKEHYPGFDHAVFRDSAKRLTAQAGAKMQAIPELMYFLDKDPTISAFFRNPVTPEEIAELGKQAQAAGQK